VLSVAPSSFTRTRLEGATPYKGRNLISPKMFTWSKYYRVNNFYVCGPSTPIFFSQVGGVVDDQELFRFSIRWSVPEIFLITVESCQKSRRNY